MAITVKLFATLQQGRFAEKEIGCNCGITVRKLLESIDLTPEEAHIILVNGRHVDLEYHMANNDTLSIFPLLGGG